MPRSKKAEERAELAKLRTITITLEASEATLQRIAALLLFSDHAPKYTVTDDAPMPFDEPTLGPHKMLEIDYNAVRNAIMGHMEKYLNKHGEEKLREVIQSFGAERLSQIPEDQLLGLERALADEAAHE